MRIVLMVIGKTDIAALLPGLQRAERVLGRPINPTAYPPTEVARKFKAAHHFIRKVIEDPAKIFVIGSASDLEAAASGKANQNASVQQGRIGRSRRRRRGKA
ncbi:MAG: hypothetical protein WD063_18715 [Pirellulales bacterium]